MDPITVCSVGLASTVLVFMLDALSAARSEKGLRPSDIVWALVIVAVHVVVFVWYAQGLVVESAYADSLIAPFVLSCTCVVGVHACFMRRAIASGVLTASAPSDRVAYRVVSLVIAVIGLLVAGGLCVLSLEIPQTASFGAVTANSVFAEWQLVCAALLALYFLGQRRCALAAIVPLACAGFGVAEYFVLLFKGQPIQPGDILAIGTAASVADGYVYTLAPVCLEGIACGVGALALLSVLSLGGEKGAALDRRAGEKGEGSGGGPARRLVSAVSGLGELDVSRCPARAHFAARNSAHDAIHGLAARGFDRGAAHKAGRGPARDSNRGDVTVLARADATEPARADAAEPARSPRGSAARNAGVLANLVVGLAFLAALVTNVVTVDYRAELGIDLSGWEPAVSYSSQAYIPTFIAACQQMVPVTPDDYDEATVDDLLASYADAYDASDAATSPERTAAEEQFSELKPSVVVVMNETFSDLSIFDGFFAGYEGPEFFKGIDDCVQRGVFYTSVQGGSTTNSEFEFLTGCSMAGFGTGVYPYNMYNLAGVENLAGVFKSLGYETIAMHPNSASNWNRKNVYRDLGFDDFLSIEDFPDADTLRGHVTDRETYKKILAALGDDSSPQFIFDVTMQNHSGYDTGLIPDDEMLHLSIDGSSGDPLVDEYVTSIQHSDEDLRYLIEQLSELDRPVVLVFFGDHQPYITPAYNDAWYTDEAEAEHQARVYQTNYIIWANYDLAGSDQASDEKDLSASFLSSEVMQAIGAPLTSFMKAHEVVSRDLPVLTGIFYEDADGGWHIPAEESGIEATDQARSDFLSLQYSDMFGSGDGIYNTHMQEVANV